MFFTRAFLGWVLIVVYIIGNTLVPITVQQTLTNTTPFWASLFAFCFVNESISRIEAVSMVVSFAAVVLITYQQASSDDESESDETKERLILQDNDTLAGLVGCLCILAMALINGIVSV